MHFASIWVISPVSSKSPVSHFKYYKEGRPGKTAHLLALRRFFPGAPYLCIDAENPLHDIPDVPVLFFDQMQCLPKRRRREIFSRSASFGIVSHINHKREFKRAKLKFELLALRGLTGEQLQRNIENRITRSRREEDKPVPSVGKEAIAQLISMFDDDLQAIHEYLYDLFQTMTEVRDVHDINSNPVR